GEGAWAADGSHELRTPFAVLRGELELAARPGRSREELAAAVASAAGEAVRLTRITDDLLLLASTDEARLTLRRELVNIRALLGRAAELAGGGAPAARRSRRGGAPPRAEPREHPGGRPPGVESVIPTPIGDAPRG